MDDDLFVHIRTGPKPQPKVKAAPKPVTKPADNGFAKEKTDRRARPRDPLKPRAKGVTKTRPQVHPQEDHERDERIQKNDKIDGDTFRSSLFSSNPEVQFHETVKVTTEISNAPLGDATFPGLGVPPRLVQTLEKMGITRPTKIQRQAVPQLAAARDTLIIAQTGSGKTFAYLVPILSQLMSESHIDRNSGLFAVIMAPTRELASQIFQVLESLVKTCHWIVPGLVIGGENRKSEKARIRKGLNVLVGTPGRVADHFENTKSLDLQEIRWVVLDEGDRLVELGFEETLTKIIDQIVSSSGLRLSQFANLPRTRTHVLCSATMSNSTDRLKTLTLRDPVWVREGNESLEQVPGQLVQQVVVVPAKLRLVALAAALRRSTTGRVVVFLSCADSVEFHYQVFSHAHGSGFFKLHGSMTQQDRVASINKFSKSENFAVLFCTDVASRGLDVVVDSVIEYDPPFSIEDHIHRVGRTARAGRSGSALLFLLPGNEEDYQQKIKTVHPHGFEHHSHTDIVEQGFGSRWEVEATSWHLDVERWILGNEQAAQWAKSAFQSHVRAYATHSSAEKQIFNLKTLHLGHLAKAFALRETPGGLNATTKNKKARLSAKDAMRLTARKHANMSEFNIG